MTESKNGTATMDPALDDAIQAVVEEKVKAMLDAPRRTELTGFAAMAVAAREELNARDQASARQLMQQAEDMLMQSRRAMGEFVRQVAEKSGEKIADNEGARLVHEDGRTYLEVVRKPDPVRTPRAAAPGAK